jgi:peptide deformylase
MLYPEDEGILRKKCEPVKEINHNVRRLIQDLKDTLEYHPDGVGLAAPQINAQERVIVVRLKGDESTNSEAAPLLTLVNPVILDQGDVQPDFDGCLSFPGLFGKTMRPHFLKIACVDERGKPLEMKFQGFDAVVVHHEIDHLEGVLFIDRIERLQDLYRITEDETGTPRRIPISDIISTGKLDHHREEMNRKIPLHHTDGILP